jgi:hypothetical protein
MRRIHAVPFAVLAAGLSVLSAVPVQAATPSPTTAAFSGSAGTASVGGTLFARQGAALTLTVTTDADTRCVEVSGAFADRQNGPAGKTTWSFTTTAVGGDGSSTVTVLARPGFNGQGSCTGTARDTATASYTSDNTAPVVNGTVAPVPGNLGWNKGDATVTWSATDAGSGVAGAPTPATSTQTAETAGTVKTATATDRVGNTGSGAVTVKLDRSGPTVTASRTPAANAAGWNNTDVTASATCVDALSGVASCAAPKTFSTDGTFTFDAAGVDNAGNTGSASLTGIKIDKTAPSLVGTPRTAPGGSGWYAGDVRIGWAASDTLSGLEGAAPADSTITGEGAHLTATASVSDRAGNTATATSAEVAIDRTAPVTTLTGGASGWTNGAVTLSLTATDNLSGVGSTLVSVDGADFAARNSITLDTDGQHTVRYRSTDRAGNEEAVRESVVRIDTTAPAVAHSFLTPAGYHDGDWTNGPVTVHFTCSDSGSGVASCSPDDTLTTEGRQTSTGHATDGAGNTGSDTATVWIDTTRPTVTGAADRPANAHGWYSAPVTVTFTCDDALSGIASCTAPVTLGHEGTNRSATGSATDKAGNSGSATVAGIDLDLTAPELSAEHASGWQNHDVAVDWSCTDTLSGVDAGPIDDVVGGEGADLRSSATCTDNAGNSASATVGGIKIDRTAPVTTASVPAPLATGWYAGPVTVTLDAQDGLSGVAATRYSVDGGATRPYTDAFDVSAPGKHTVRFWSTDVAGNTEDSDGDAHVIAFKIDDIAPTTTVTDPIAPESGWFVQCGVPVAFSAVDAESGVAATYFTVDGGTTETYGEPFTRCLGDGQHTISYWSVDNAGNAEAPRDHLVNVDTVAPSITGTASPEANAFGWNDSAVTVSFDCSDATPGSGLRVGEDGLAACGPDAVLANEGAGQSASGRAVDVAGNHSEATVSGINIDKTKPTISGAARGANGAGWFTGDAEVAWACADQLSGIVGPDHTIMGPDRAFSTSIGGEGRNLSGSATCTDAAGNAASGTVDGVKIDRGAPSVAGHPTTSPNADGWYRSAVTVDWTCTDPDLADGTSGSGVAACPTSTVLDRNGADQVAGSGRPTDVAGNTGDAATVGGIDIDGTAPVTTADNRCVATNGWCTGSTADVVLTAVDQPGLSGVRAIHYRVDGGTERVVSGDRATVTVPLSGSGAGTVAYWAEDRAGNQETSNTVALKWDNIAPTVSHSLAPAPNSGGWNNSDVTVSFTAKDDDRGSGVASVSGPVTVSAETPAQVVTGTAKDTAGNTGTDAVTVRLDKTKPTITAAVTAGRVGGNGWYVGPVTVSFTCADALSDVAVCPDPVVLSEDGADNQASGTVLDKAGNSATATLGGIKIDHTAPTITARDVNVSGGSYVLGSVPAATCTATDTGSGMASCTVAVTGGPSGGAGTFTWTATAKDKAGNVTVLTGTYQVTYRFDGFLQPINDTAHQVGATTSIFKAGSTVPVKLQLRNAAGQVVQPATAPVWLTPVKGSSTTLPVDESVYTGSADSGSTYRLDTDQWIYNWKTGSAGGSYWRIGVRLDDGQTYYVNIGLR